MGRPDGETAVRELDMKKFWELEVFISVNQARCQRPAMQTYLAEDERKPARGL
jgi:hypothetical protein